MPSLHICIRKTNCMICRVWKQEICFYFSSFLQFYFWFRYHLPKIPKTKHEFQNKGLVPQGCCIKIAYTQSGRCPISVHRFYGYCYNAGLLCKQLSILVSLNSADLLTIQQDPKSKSPLSVLSTHFTSVHLQASFSQ